MLNVIFENDHFIAVDKSSGCLSVPSRAGRADLRPCLTTALEARGLRVLPVHRLDQEVSGVVLFAKNAPAHRAANLWFENRCIHKVYEAWTENAGVANAAPPFDEPQLWESLLLRGKKRSYSSLHGKLARTRATRVSEKLLSNSGVWAQVWLLEPLTGRSHQLRFELAQHGFPIIGDALYGAKTPYFENAIALRAVKLDFSGCKDALEYGLPIRIEVKGVQDA